MAAMARLYYGNAPISTRRLTPEGFLRAEATLTRTGIHEFKREELEGISGVPDRPDVKIEFTEDSVFDSDTLDSIRGVPVTLGHPAGNEKLVRPDTWQHYSRGSVVGDATPDETNGLLQGEVIVGDKQAIEAITNGTSQLSIGYTMGLEKTEDGAEADFRTTGPIEINHIALVETGRSGSSVRVMNEGGLMTEAEIKTLGEAISQQITSAINSDGGNVGKAVSDALANGLKPLVEKVESVVSANADAESAAKKAEAEKQATEAANRLRDETLREERARVQVLNDASALLGPESVQGLQNSSVKEILVAACANIVPDADSQSEDYLRGVLTASAGRTPITNTNFVNTSPAPQATARHQSLATQVDSAYGEYVKHLQNAHLAGNSDSSDEAGS